VLYGAFARGQLLREPVETQRAEVDTLRRMIRVGWGRDDPAYRQAFASMFLPDAPLEKLRALAELQRRSASAENAERILETFSALDVRDLAPRVSAPTLVLHARGDVRIPFDEGRLLASLVPGAELVPVEGRNHVPLAGDPAFEHVVREVDRFLGTAAATEPRRRALPERLTPREEEVLELLARGFDNAAIAARLSIREKTVRNHVSALFSKLAVSHRAAAVVRARAAGFGLSDEHSS
jgi:DNA-binding CsgD family transcriptional regulator